MFTRESMKLWGFLLGEFYPALKFTMLGELAMYEYLPSK